MAGIADIGRLVATLGLNTTPFMAGADAATSKMKQLNASAMMVGRTMTRFVTLPMALAGGAAVGMQKNFEASMTKIIGQVGVSRKQVEAWNKEVLAMSTATGRGPEELADALYFVTSAGIRGAEAMEVLEMSAKAAAVGMGETKVIADLVTSAMNAYGKENLSAAQATDILAASVREGKAEADELAGAMGMVLPIASEFGVTFDQVGAAFAGMTRTGTNARVASTQLKAILSAMASPSKQAQDALSKYAMSAEDFRKTVREDGLIQAMLDLRTATEGNESALSEIFPNIRALMGVLDLLGQNVEYNVAIFESLKNASGSLERAFAEVGGTTQQKLNVALATLKATFVEIGGVLKGTVVNILTHVNDVMKRLVMRIQTMTEAQKTWNLAIVKFVAVLGPAAIIISRIVAIASSAIAPYLAVAVAIIAVAVAVGKLINNMKTASAMRRRSEKEQKKIIENSEKEAAVVGQVFARLKMAKAGTEEWDRARKQVNSQYGAYLTNLVKEEKSHENIEEALKEVTAARMADMKVKGYAQEIERVSAEYQGAIVKKLSRWTKVVSKGRDELWEEARKTPFDFDQAFNNAVLEGVQKMRDGGSLQNVGNEMKESVNQIYSSFIGELENAPKFGAAQFRFVDDYMKALELKFAEIARTEGLQEAIDELTKTGDGVLTIDVQIGNLDKEIALMDSVKDTEDERVRLNTLINLHKKKAGLLTGELKTAELAVVDGLKEELRIHNQIQSSLGAEVQAEAAIEKLKDDRKKLSKDELTANSKALDAAERKLTVLQIETSALNDQAKKAEMLRVNEEQLKTLSGDKLENATKQLQQDQLAYALQAAKASGLNKEQKFLMQITAYKEYGKTLDDDAREANKVIVADLEKQAKAQARKYSDAGKLGKLQMDLVDLEEEAAKLSDDKAISKEAEIRNKETEIALEQERLDGLNEIAKLENKIGRMEEDNSRLKGTALKENKDAILLEQQRLIALKKAKGELTDIEQLQLDILEIELLQLQTTDPVKAAMLQAEKEALEAKKAGMEGDTTAGLQFEAKGSKGYIDALNEIIATQSAVVAGLEAKDESGSDAHKIAVQNLKAAQQEKLDTYLGYFNAVLSAASQFTDAMSALTEAQKQRELSAAGDNAKKREEIELKYRKKQKRWAVSQSLINTALAATAALTNPTPGFKWVDFAAVLVAGAVQTAAIAAQSFAAGGIVSGPTLGLMGEYPGAKSNPEVIAPLSDLKKMLGTNVNLGGMPKVIELKLRGRDAYALVNMEQLMQNTY